MHIKHTELTIVRGDITTLAAEAIVNPANPELTMDAGLAGAIAKKGGPAVAAAAAARAPVAPGEAVSTEAGTLGAKQIIHAVTVGRDRHTDEHLIRRACANALDRAAQDGLSSVALPALGCGTGGFPITASAKIMTQEIIKHCRWRPTTLRAITICLLDEETFRGFESTVTGYVTHLQDDLGNGPYVTVDAIIELPDGIVLIERSNPPFGWALPGGFVDAGESLETAAAREAEEETGLRLEDLRQFHTYSAPDRDPRFHTVSTVFIGRGVGTPRHGSDARGLAVVPFADLPDREYAFDHKTVIADYLAQRREGAAHGR